MMTPPPGSSPAPPASAALTAFLDEHGFATGKVNQRNPEGVTPLMVAARLAPPALVAELIAAGADVHAVNKDGNQALWLACVTQRCDNIGLLVAAGIEVDHVNANGATPLMFAASAGRDKAVAALLAAGADPLLGTDLGLSAIEMASTAECLALLRAAARHRRG